MDQLSIRKTPLLLCLMLSSLATLWLMVQHIAVPAAREDLKTYQDNREREDFMRSYIASELVISGQPALAYNRSAYLGRLTQRVTRNPDETTGWLYPPVYFFIVQPLAYLPYKLSFFLSLTVQGGLFIAASHRFLWRKPYELLVLLSPSVFAGLSWGQNGVLLAALYIAAFRNLLASPILAGALFGCCIIKPQLGILLPALLLAGGHYKTLASAFLTALVLIILSMLVYGADSWIEYLHAMLPGGSGMHPAPANLSISLGYRFPSVRNMLRLMGFSAPASLAFQALVTLCCLWQICAMRGGNRSNPIAIMASFSLLSLLSFPYFGIYDYPLVTTAILSLFLQAEPTARFGLSGVAAVLAAYYIVAIHAVVINKTGLILTPLVLILIYLCLQRRGSASEPCLTSDPRPSACN